MLDVPPTATFILPLALTFLAGYLVGSIPFGFLITRAAGAGDIRAIGSGNIGATNVLRTGRKGLAIATLIGDILKGALPVWLVHAWLGSDPALMAGAGAILGHCFPAWLGFRGGKGVATAAGVILGLTPLAVPILVAIFVGVVWVSRFVSLGSIVAAALAPVTAWALGAAAPAMLYVLIAALVIAKHHGNIARLLKGQENRLGAKKAA